MWTAYWPQWLIWGLNFGDITSRSSPIYTGINGAVAFSHLFDIHTMPVVILLWNCGPPGFENKLVIEWSAHSDNTTETVTGQPVATEPTVINGYCTHTTKVWGAQWPATASLWSVTKRWSLIKAASWMFSSECWIEVHWLKHRILSKVAAIWFSCCPYFYALCGISFHFLLLAADILQLHLIFRITHNAWNPVLRQQCFWRHSPSSPSSLLIIIIRMWRSTLFNI